MSWSFLSSLQVRINFFLQSVEGVVKRDSAVDELCDLGICKQHGAFVALEFRSRNGMVERFAEERGRQRSRDAFAEDIGGRGGFEDAALGGKALRMREDALLRFVARRDVPQECPGERFFVRARGDAREQDAERGMRRAARLLGQWDAVPFEIHVLLDAPRIGLVRAVFGERERAERDAAKVEVARRDLVAARERRELHAEAHGLLDFGRGEIRGTAVVAEELCTRRRGRSGSRPRGRRRRI